MGFTVFAAFPRARDAYPWLIAVAVLTLSAVRPRRAPRLLPLPVGLGRVHSCVLDPCARLLRLLTPLLWRTARLFSSAAALGLQALTSHMM